MFIKNEYGQNYLPDFFIVGAARSGTTSLYYYLNEHPQIYMPALKEPWFFSHFGENSEIDKKWAHKVVKKVDDYFKLFPQSDCEGKVCGEASISYLYYHKQTISNLKKFYGDKLKGLKIIIILRHPVERMHSQYNMFEKDAGNEILPFEEAIKPHIIKERLEKGFDPFYDYVGFSMYYEAVKDYYENFPKLKIFFYEELKNNPECVVKDIFDFLKVNKDFRPESLNKVFHSSGEPKNAFLKPVYHFVMEKNVIKDLIKMVISEKMRSNLRKVKSGIAGKITRSKNIDYSHFSNLFNQLYKNDIERLYRLFKSSKTFSKRAEFLEKWMS